MYRSWGGHTNRRSGSAQLAVAILGRATCLLSSFDARPGDELLFAIDLRGRFEAPYAHWNASTTASGERLRTDLEILPGLAESGLCAAAKDISMAGAVGTALMLLECSGCGAVIDATAIPRPPGVDLLHWLTAFPSYGFVMSVRPENRAAVLARFAARDIACAVAGSVRAGSSVALRCAAGDDAVPLWDFCAMPFIVAPGGAPTRAGDAGTEARAKRARHEASGAGHTVEEHV